MNESSSPQTGALDSSVYNEGPKSTWVDNPYFPLFSDSSLKASQFYASSLASFLVEGDCRNANLLDLYDQQYTRLRQSIRISDQVSIKLKFVVDQFTASAREKESTSKILDMIGILVSLAKGGQATVLNDCLSSINWCQSSDSSCLLVFNMFMDSFVDCVKLDEKVFCQMFDLAIRSKHLDAVARCLLMEPSTTVLDSPFSHKEVRHETQFVRCGEDSFLPRFCDLPCPVKSLPVDCFCVSDDGFVVAITTSDSQRLLCDFGVTGMFGTRLTHQETVQLALESNEKVVSHDADNIFTIRYVGRNANCWKFAMNHYNNLKQSGESKCVSSSFVVDCSSLPSSNYKFLFSALDGRLHCLLCRESSQPTQRIMYTTSFSFKTHTAEEAVVRNDAALKRVPLSDKKLPTALLFNKKSSVRIGNVSLKKQFEPFCVEVWVHPAGLVQECYTVLSIGNKAVDEVLIEVEPAPQGVLWRGGARTPQLGHSFVSVFVPGKLATTKRWWHIALNYTGVKWELIVDTTYCSSERATVSANGIVDAKCTLGTFFAGFLAEVRVWNKSRPLHLLKRDWKRALRGTEDGLIGYFPLNEQQGNVLVDLSSESHHALLNETWGTGENEGVTSDSGNNHHRGGFAWVSVKNRPVLSSFEEPQLIADFVPLALAVDTGNIFFCTTPDYLCVVTMSAGNFINLYYYDLEQLVLVSHNKTELPASWQLKCVSYNAGKDTVLCGCVTPRNDRQLAIFEIHNNSMPAVSSRAVHISCWSYARQLLANAAKYANKFLSTEKSLTDQINWWHSEVPHFVVDNEPNAFPRLISLADKAIEQQDKEMENSLSVLLHVNLLFKFLSSPSKCFEALQGPYTSIKELTSVIQRTNFTSKSNVSLRDKIVQMSFQRNWSLSQLCLGIFLNETARTEFIKSIAAKKRGDQEEKIFRSLLEYYSTFQSFSSILSTSREAEAFFGALILESIFQVNECCRRKDFTLLSRVSHCLEIFQELLSARACVKSNEERSSAAVPAIISSVVASDGSSSQSTSLGNNIDTAAELLNLLVKYGSTLLRACVTTAQTIAALMRKNKSAIDQESLSTALHQSHIGVLLPPFLLSLPLFPLSVQSKCIRHIQSCRDALATLVDVMDSPPWLHSLQTSLAFCLCLVGCSLLQRKPNSISSLGTENDGVNRIPTFSASNEENSAAVGALQKYMRLLRAGFRKGSGDRDQLIKGLVAGTGKLSEIFNGLLAKDASASRIKSDERLKREERCVMAAMCALMVPTASLTDSEDITVLEGVYARVKKMRLNTLAKRQSNKAYVSELQARAEFLSLFDTCFSSSDDAETATSTAAGVVMNGSGSPPPSIITVDRNRNENDDVKTGDFNDSKVSTTYASKIPEKTKWKKMFRNWKAMRSARTLISSHDTGNNKHESEMYNLIVLFLESDVDCDEVALEIENRLAKAKHRLNGLTLLKELLTEAKVNVPLGNLIIPPIVQTLRGWHYAQNVDCIPGEELNLLHNAYFQLWDVVVSKCLELVQNNAADSSPKTKDDEGFESVQKRAAVRKLWTLLLVGLMTTEWRLTDFLKMGGDVFRCLKGLCESCIDPSSVDLVRKNGNLPISFRSSVLISRLCGASMKISKDGTLLSSENGKSTCVAPTSWSSKRKFTYYFEATIVDLADGSTCILGVGRSDYSLSRPPGWDADSCALQSDDGLLFTGSSQFKLTGYSFGKGDVVGCGWDIEKSQIFWTRNGRKTVTTDAPKLANMSPLIGTDGRAVLKLNFGQEMFVYKDFERRASDLNSFEAPIHLDLWDALRVLSLRVVCQVAELARPKDSATEGIASLNAEMGSRNFDTRNDKNNNKNSNTSNNGSFMDASEGSNSSINNRSLPLRVAESGPLKELLPVVGYLCTELSRELSRTTVFLPRSEHYTKHLLLHIASMMRILTDFVGSPILVEPLTSLGEAIVKLLENFFLDESSSSTDTELQSIVLIAGYYVTFLLPTDSHPSKVFLNTLLYLCQYEATFSMGFFGDCGGGSLLRKGSMMDDKILWLSLALLQRLNDVGRHSCSPSLYNFVHENLTDCDGMFTADTYIALAVLGGGSRLAVPGDRVKVHKGHGNHENATLIYHSFSDELGLCVEDSKCSFSPLIDIQFLITNGDDFYFPSKHSAQHLVEANDVLELAIRMQNAQLSSTTESDFDSEEKDIQDSQIFSILQRCHARKVLRLPLCLFDSITSVTFHVEAMQQYTVNTNRLRQSKVMIESWQMVQSARDCMTAMMAATYSNLNTLRQTALSNLSNKNSFASLIAPELTRTPYQLYETDLYRTADVFFNMDQEDEEENSFIRDDDNNDNNTNKFNSGSSSDVSIEVDTQETPSDSHSSHHSFHSDEDDKVDPARIKQSVETLDYGEDFDSEPTVTTITGSSTDISSDSSMGTPAETRQAGGITFAFSDVIQPDKSGETLYFGSGGCVKLDATQPIGVNYTVDFSVRVSEVNTHQILFVQPLIRKDDLVVSTQLIARIYEGKVEFGCFSCCPGREKHAKPIVLCYYPTDVERDVGNWMRLTFVQNSKSLFLFKDGDLQDTQNLPRENVPVLLHEELSLGGSSLDPSSTLRGDMRHILFFNSSFGPSTLKEMQQKEIKMTDPSLILSLKWSNSTTLSNVAEISGDKPEMQVNIEGAVLNSELNRDDSITTYDGNEYLTEGDFSYETEDIEMPKPMNEEKTFITMASWKQGSNKSLDELSDMYTSCCRLLVFFLRMLILSDIASSPDASPVAQNPLSQQLTQLSRSETEEESDMDNFIDCQKVMLHDSMNMSLECALKTSDDAIYSNLRKALNDSISGKLVNSGASSVLSFADHMIRNALFVSSSYSKVCMVESAHPFPILTRSVHEVHVPEGVVYHIYVDPQTKSSNLFFSFCGAQRTNPFQFVASNFTPFQCSFPLIFFEVHSDGTSPQWGYKVFFVYNCLPQLRAMRLFNDFLFTILETKGGLNRIPFLSSSKCLHDLSRCAINNVGKTRRLAISALSTLLLLIPNFDNVEPPLLKDVHSIRRMAENLYRGQSKEQSIQSRFVQMVTEFYTIFMDVYRCWSVVDVKSPSKAIKRNNDRRRSSTKDRAYDWAWGTDDPEDEPDGFAVSNVRKTSKKYEKALVSGKKDGVSNGGNNDDDDEPKEANDPDDMMSYSEEKEAFNRRRQRQESLYHQRSHVERVIPRKWSEPQSLQLELTAEQKWSAKSGRRPCSMVIGSLLQEGCWYFEVNIQSAGDVYIGAMPSYDTLSRGQGTAESVSFNGLLGLMSGDTENTYPSIWATNDTVGVVLDIDNKVCKFLTNGLENDTITLSLDASDDLAVTATTRALRNLNTSDDDTSYYPFILLSPDEQLTLNFGSTFFEYPLPSDCLPLDPAHMMLGSLLPYNYLRTFQEIAAHILTDGTHALPPFFHDESEPFAGCLDRSGPAHVSIVLKENIEIDGLDVRNPTNDFVTLTADCCVSDGMWYYEVVLQSQGLMQIGWSACTKNVELLHPSSVGDSNSSWSVDLFRRVCWHSGLKKPVIDMPRRWAVGDVIGSALDLTRGELTFYLNGRPIRTVNAITAPTFSGIPSKPTIFYVPTISLRCGNAVGFNFGAFPFSYKPDGFRSLGVLNSWNARMEMFYANEHIYSTVHRLGVLRRLFSLLGSNKDGKFAHLKKFRLLVKVADEYCKETNKNYTQVTADELKNYTEKKHYRDEVFDKDALQSRFSVLLSLARVCQSVLPFIALQKEKPGLSARMFLAVRDLLFASLRQDLVNSALRDTNNKPENYRISINRVRARTPPKSLSTSVLGQTINFMAELPPRLFQTDKRFWNTVLLGEGAEDVGGPFREHISEICREVVSPELGLFVPTSNQTQNMGSHRDAFVPAPSATSESQLRAFEFLGKLMGGCLRCEEPMSLTFPPLVWKYLCGCRIGEEDIRDVDQLSMQCIEEFRNIHRVTQSTSEFDSIFDTERFVARLSDGSLKELIPGGAGIRVTYERSKEYAERLLELRLHEFDVQLDSIRRGLVQVIPETVLLIFEPKELELRVCGKPDYTVEEVRKTTIYEGLTAEDKRVSLLWSALEEATPQQRRLFLRFVSGRDRLPIRLRVVPLATQGDPDTLLPRAATCFYVIELPEYSSLDVMKSKLYYCIENCIDIDTDFDARVVDASENPRLTMGSEAQNEGNQNQAQSETANQGA